MPGVAELFTESHRLSAIVPASRSGVEVNTGWVSMRDYHKAVFIVGTGAIAAAGIVDAQILQATDLFGTGVKVITGKQITPLGGGDDDSMCVIELDASELDVDNGFDCILGSISCGGAAACLTAGLLIRYIPRYAPVGVVNLAEVVN